MLRSADGLAFRRSLGIYVVAALLCLAGHGWLGAPGPRGEGGLYLYSHPRGARVRATTAAGATGQSGTRQVMVGYTPGPLRIESGRSQLVTLELFGYRPRTLVIRPGEFVDNRYPPRGFVSLEPRIPVLSPSLYFARDHVFLLALAALSLGFARLRLRPLLDAVRSERRFERLLGAGKLEEGTLIGPYRLGPLLGMGGMARVFRATRRDEPRGESLALKILWARLRHDPEGVARFQREIRISSRLCHPHIVHFLDWGEVHGHHYLVAELVEGETLAARLQSTRPPVLEAVRWARQIAQGLAYAHGHEVVHRDVKPSNVMIREDGRAVLLDFGIARQRELLAVPPLWAGARDDQEITRAGDAVGTPGYMAPEQLENRADWRSDLYSLGVLLYEALGGTRPFQAENPLLVIARQLQGDIPPLPRAEAPAELAALVHRLLRADPQERAASSTQVVEELQQIEQGLTSGGA